MKIELGRTYRARNGERVIIKNRFAPSSSPYMFSDSQGRTYTGDGRYVDCEIEHEFNLIELIEYDPAKPQATDHDVRQRAMHNADAPYDQRTCEHYPWAAAARIEWLEQNLKMSDDIGNGLQRELKNLNEIHARQSAQVDDLLLRLNRAQAHNDALVKSMTELASAKAPPPMIIPRDIAEKVFGKPDGIKSDGITRPPPRTISFDQWRIYSEKIEEISVAESRLNTSIRNVEKHIYDPHLRNMVEADMRKRGNEDIERIKREVRNMGLPLVEELPGTMDTQKAVSDGPMDQ